MCCKSGARTIFKIVPQRIHSRARLELSSFFSGLTLEDCHDGLLSMPRELVVESVVDGGP